MGESEDWGRERMGASVCVCVCVREGERMNWDGQRERGRKNGWVRDREKVGGI